MGKMSIKTYIVVLTSFCFPYVQKNCNIHSIILSHIVLLRIMGLFLVFSVYLSFIINTTQTRILFYTLLEIKT